MTIAEPENIIILYTLSFLIDRLLTLKKKHLLINRRRFDSDLNIYRLYLKSLCA